MKWKYKRYIIFPIISLTIILILTFNFTSLKKIYFITFHKSGVITHFNEHPNLDEQVITYLNGRISQTANLKHGLLDGWMINYYPNGMVQDKSYYKNNKIDSIKYSYYGNGKIKSQEGFKNGKYDGPRIKYYQNGQTENKSFRKNNKVDGKEYEYYENGNLKYTRNWINNRPYGDNYYYYDDKNAKVEFYHAYDILGAKFYIDRYDELKTEGFVFSSNIYSKDRDSIIILKDGNKYKSIGDLYVTVANPPNILTEIEIVINHKHFKKMDFIDYNTVKISNAFLNKGVYNVVVDGRFVDKSNMIIASTTLEITIIKE